MLKAALITLGTRPTKVMVIAEFVICCTALDFIEDSGVDVNRRIESEEFTGSVKARIGDLGVKAMIHML